MDEKHKVTVYFFIKPFSRPIGSLSHYKISQMIIQHYGHMAIHRDVLKTNLRDFDSINGELHNIEWLGL